MVEASVALGPEPMGVLDKEQLCKSCIYLAGEHDEAVVNYRVCYKFWMEGRG
jgi:hypothetical protein